MAVVKDIGHVVIPVDDMEKAIAFYRDVLGFRVVGKVNPVWTVVEVSGGQLTLYRNSKLPKVAGGPGGEGTPFEFHVDDFEKAASFLQSRWIRVKKEGANAGTVWDPFGNALRLHDHRADEVGSAAKP